MVGGFCWRCSSESFMVLRENYSDFLWVSWYSFYGRKRASGVLFYFVKLRIGNLNNSISKSANPRRLLLLDQATAAFEQQESMFRKPRLLSPQEQPFCFSYPTPTFGWFGVPQTLRPRTSRPQPRIHRVRKLGNLGRDTSTRKRQIPRTNLNLEGVMLTWKVENLNPFVKGVHPKNI